jgi:hypothetical protein
MQHIFSKNEGSVSKSNVLLLPIIDLPPGDDTCIYSTLLFINNQAGKLGIPTPCITFDQPLWIKAISIIKCKSMNIVCRLGGFHMLMSFIGSIGFMMKGSGLEEALECVYGVNALTHMISGKAVSRALRGHYLVQAALVHKLIEAVTHQDSVDSASYQDSVDSASYQEVDKTRLKSEQVQKILELYKCVTNKEIDISDAAESSDLLSLEKLLKVYKETLAEKSRTAKLWLQYIEYVEILKLFIRAERTGNWNMHLVSVGKMLNLFAATGHINYAKSSRLYLQQMLELPTNYPRLYNCFVHGNHAVRRSERY